MVICTKSAEETMALGRALGERLGAGDVVALSGGLGAGKTTMTKGIAAGAGVKSEVHSPTFTLIHEHSGRVPFYHVDLYRLTGNVDTALLGIEEYLYGEGIVVIEWADRAAALLPEERIDVELRASGDNRQIEIYSESDRLCKLIESVVTDARASD